MIIMPSRRPTSLLSCLHFGSLFDFSALHLLSLPVSCTRFFHPYRSLSQ